MTLRGATLLVHWLLVALFLGAAAFLVWLTVTYTPDPEDDFGFSPGFIAIPMAVGLLIVAGSVAWLVRQWTRSGKRGLLALADVLAALALLVVPVLLPPALLLAGLGTVVVAGGFVAANRPEVARMPQPPTRSTRGGRGLLIVAVIALAVVAGLMLAGPLLLMGSSVEP